MRLAIPLRWFLAPLLLVGALVGLPRARAQDGLEGLGAALGSEDASARQSAIASLRALPPSEHDAIVARIASLVRRAPSVSASDELLTAFRRATGSRRADDVVDVADGIESVLATRHDEAAVRTAELLLLCRALEAHGDPHALSAAIEVFRVPGSGWEMEGRRFTLRLNEAVAGTALRALGHGDVHVREWARWSVRRLGVDAPGTYVRGLSPSVLADVLVAYGDARLMVAMPVVGSFVDAPQRTVREGAFAGLAAYGRNAIWTIREAYRLHADEDASTEWGAERTLTALRAVIDERRLASARAALTDAQAALAAGEVDRAVELADAVLVSRPELGGVEVARIYLAAGEHALEARRAVRARALLSRAERLAEVGGDAALRARAAGLSQFVRAEVALGEGVLDVDAYARAAAAVPDDAHLAELSAGYAAAPRERADRTWTLAIAAALFLGVSLLLFFGGRSATSRPSALAPAAVAPAPPATPSASDDTLPGDDAAITSPG